MVFRATIMNNYIKPPVYRRICIIIICIFLPLSIISTQNPTAEAEESFEPVDYQDTWTSPMISDELTRDLEQNKTWRMGDYKFSSQPKNA
jgi:hypothetical protein